jgi:hypothetical protein
VFLENKEGYGCTTLCKIVIRGRLGKIVYVFLVNLVSSFAYNEI